MTEDMAEIEKDMLIYLPFFTTIKDNKKSFFFFFAFPLPPFTHRIRWKENHSRNILKALEFFL